MRASLPLYIRYGCWVLLAAGIVSVLYHSVIAPYPERDFRFFWLAGTMWAHGLDPYGLAYGAMARAKLPAGNMPSAWVYPPQWWPICRFLALFSLHQAVVIWRLASDLMFVGGTWLVACALFADRGEAAKFIAAAAAGAACLIEPTSVDLALGQNGAFAYLGLCLLVTGLVSSSLPIEVLAILLLSLKPQIGIPIILALLFLKSWRLPVVLAAIAGLIIALPQLLPFGPIATLTRLLANLGGYTGNALTQGLNPNIPVACTGVLNLIGHFARNLTLLPGYVAGLVAALVTGFLMRNTDQLATLEWLTLLISLVITIIPLHAYDMTVLAIVPLMLLRIRTDLGMVALAAMALALRPTGIERFFGLAIYGGHGSTGQIGESLAAVLLTVLAGYLVISNRRNVVPSARNAR